MTDAPDQDDELYNPESEHDLNEKKGACYCGSYIFIAFLSKRTLYGVFLNPRLLIFETGCSGGLRVLLRDSTMAAWHCWDLKTWPSDL